MSEHHPIRNLDSLFHSQKRAFVADPVPSLQSRLDKLDRLKKELILHHQDLIEAMSQDFGVRSRYDCIFGDIISTLQLIKYTSKNLRNWMKPSRRSAGMMLAPARVEVIYRPLGVVGIISPWNFPVQLCLMPLITALAAGNRVMIKLSEYTPVTNAALGKLLCGIFPRDEVCTVEGDATVAETFSKLPFDHLLFTGSTSVGRHVLTNAAANLTPVTLELGGKSPCLIAPDMPLDAAIDRIVYGKSLNAGQICIAPDYILIPRGKEEAFAQGFVKKFQTFYPSGIKDDGYTSIINSKQYSRLSSWLDEAKEKGAKVIPCGEPSCDAQNRRMLPHLLLNTPHDCTLMNEEIFGPLLPVIPYDSIREAIAYIKERPHPLALYLMSFDQTLQKKVLSETQSGGVCINDTLMHVAADDAPFGGIGPSGMGHYHGHEGFLTFSKAKTVLTRGRFYPAKYIQPPFDTPLKKFLINWLIR